MKKILFILLIINSYNLTAQDVGCDCGRSPIVEFGAISNTYKNYNDNEKTYQWFIVWTSPEGLCIPRNHTAIEWPKMQRVILEALYNDKTYKQLLASEDETMQKAKLGIELSHGGFFTKGGISNNKRANVVIQLNANIRDFVTPYRKCSEVDKEETNSNESSSSNNNDNSNNNSSTSSSSNSPSDYERIQNETQTNIDRIEANSKALTEKITQLGTTIIDGYYKEKDFQNEINSLTTIQATDATGVIAEAKQKVQQINQSFNQRSSEKYNEVNQVGGTLIQGSKSETELGFNVAATAIAHGVMQNNIKKEKEAAITKLEHEKEIELQKIAEKFAEPYWLSYNKNIKLISLSLNENDALYYGNLGNYDGCMINNARQIIVNEASCELDQTGNKPLSKNNYTGQEYYDAYKLKLNSDNKYFRKNAEYFLELATQKEPENIEWLYESSQFYNITDKLAILKKCNELSIKFKSSNNKHQIEYEKYLRLYKKLESNLSLEKEKIKERMDFEKKIYSKHGDKIIIVSDHFNDNGLLRIVKQNNVIGNYVPRSKYGCINKEGEIIIPMEYKNMSDFHNGLASVYKGGKWGYINRENELIIDYQFKDFYTGRGFMIPGAGEFSANGLAKVVLKKKVGYINSSGDFIIKPIYYNGEEFCNGVSMVKKSRFSYDNNVYLDSKGKEISKETYEIKRESTCDNNKYAYNKFNENGFYGIKLGSQIIIPAQYDYIEFGDDGYFIVAKKHEFGVIDVFGEIIFPFIYDDIKFFHNGTYILRTLNSITGYNSFNVKNIFNQIIISGNGGEIYKSKQLENRLIRKTIYTNNISTHELFNTVGQLIGKK